jgi:amino-acid N-acetyltransferase
MTIRRARREDIDSIHSLLTAAGLPATDVLEAAAITFLVTEGDRCVIDGCVGLEGYGRVGLLRSLAVTPAAQKAGIGHSLVAAVEEAAMLRGIHRLYLLTTTASDFFARSGYEIASRDAAPHAVQQSVQFSMLCPASAVCMSKNIPKAC